MGISKTSLSKPPIDLDEEWNNETKMIINKAFWFKRSKEEKDHNKNTSPLKYAVFKQQKERIKFKRKFSQNSPAVNHI
jgi:hypothetical protein